MRGYFVLLFICFSLLSGCSNVKPYESNKLNNLLITSKTDPDVKTSIDIYHVNKACELSYRGSLSLDNPKYRIGLANNQLNYLIVNFATSSFWSASSSSMSQDMLLTPQKKYNYHLNVSYIDNIYNIDLKASHIKSKKTIPIETSGLNACTIK